jgi:CDP-glycerol glycerophosphotransferase
MDACPALAAADVMVTDHSSIGFEYLVLDRPLIVFDAPDLMKTARINPEKVDLLRSAAVVARTAAEVGVLARQEMLDAARLSALRRLAAGEVFYRPGGATDRAIEVIDGLMARRRGAGPEPVADGRSALGGLS